MKRKVPGLGGVCGCKLVLEMIPHLIRQVYKLYLKSNRFDLKVLGGYSNVFCVLYREIGPRSKIWSEKEYVDKAAFEFSEVSVTQFCVARLTHVGLMV